MIGYEFGGVTLLADILAVGVVRTERGVVIVALIVEQAVEVETLGLALHVPLAHHGGRISPLPQQLREERFARVDARPQLPLAVLVAVKPRHEARAARRGERIFDIRPREEHPFGRESVDIGRRSEPRKRMTVSADGLVGVVVGHDVDDIERLALHDRLLHAGRRRECGSYGGCVSDGSFHEMEVSVSTKIGKIGHFGKRIGRISASRRVNRAWRASAGQSSGPRGRANRVRAVACAPPRSRADATSRGGYRSRW